MWIMSGVPPFAKRNEASSAPPSARNLVGLPVQNWTYSSRALWKLAFSPVCVYHTQVIAVMMGSRGSHTLLLTLPSTVNNSTIQSVRCKREFQKRGKVLFFFQWRLFCLQVFRGGMEAGGMLPASTPPRKTCKEIKMEFKNRNRN